MLNPLWLLFSIVVWLKKTTSLPKLYFYLLGRFFSKFLLTGQNGTNMRFNFNKFFEFQFKQWFSTFFRLRHILGLLQNWRDTCCNFLIFVPKKKGLHKESVSDFLLFAPQKRCSLKKSLHFESVSDFLLFSLKKRCSLNKKRSSF